jgi:hypothetical protein
MLNKFCSQYEFAFAKSSLSTQLRRETQSCAWKICWARGDTATKKKAWEKNHHRQFIIVSLGFERASTGKKFYLLKSLDFFRVFRQCSSSGEKRKRGKKLKLIQPYEHSSDMRWMSW